MNFKVGDCVRLTQDVDRYPDFVAKSGSTGIVESISDEVFSVRLDEHLDGAEEWENCVWWYDFCDPSDDLELVR